MAHGKTMVTLAKKGVQPDKNFQKVLKKDIKADYKVAKKGK